MQAIAARAPSDAATLLALWERGLGHSDWARGDILLQAAEDAPAPPRTLGERTVRLLEMHSRLFGPALSLLSHCPACATAVQFAGDGAALAAQLTPSGTASSYRLDCDGMAIEFRLPDSADVVAAAGTPSEDAFVQTLLDRCVLSCSRDGAPLPASALPAAAHLALSEQIEMLDPGASVSFALACPQCDTRWNAPLDVGQLLWQKVQAAAERLLVDVDRLASAYGWTEQDVLALNPLRRAAYLQLVTA